MLEINGIEKLMHRVIVTSFNHQWMLGEVREADGNKYRIKCHKLSHTPGAGFVEFVLMRQPFRKGVYRLYNDAFSPNKTEVKIEQMRDLDSFVDVLRNILTK